MKKRHLLLILLVAFACFAIMFLVFKRCLQEGKRAMMIGTVKAVHAALASELDKGNIILKEALSLADRRWRFLSAEQHDRLITELGKSHNLDPPADWDSPPYLDFWGNRLEIGYRELRNEICDFIVISKGPDGTYGTNDDVVSVYGILPPVKINAQAELK